MRLVFGIGNPSRGDDALGPLCLGRIEAMGLADVELLTDFQLQIEHVLDLQGLEEVIFVDASVADCEPYRFAAVSAAEDSSYTSHALSPQALLAAYRKHFGKPEPPAYLLAIRGYSFELGDDLSPEAARNLQVATEWLATRLGAKPT